MINQGPFTTVCLIALVKLWFVKLPNLSSQPLLFGSFWEERGGFPSLVECSYKLVGSNHISVIASTSLLLIDIWLLWVSFFGHFFLLVLIKRAAFGSP